MSTPTSRFVEGTFGVADILSFIIKSVASIAVLVVSYNITASDTFDFADYAIYIPFCIMLIVLFVGLTSGFTNMKSKMKAEGTTHRSSNYTVEMNTNDSEFVCEGYNDGWSYKLYKHTETGGFFYLQSGYETFDTGEPYDDVESWTLENCGAKGLKKLQPYL